MRIVPGRIWTVPDARVEPPRGAAPAGVARVRVEGLVCDLCAARVARALHGVPGVESVRVDLDAGVAEVRRRPDVPDGALEAAVRRAALFMRARRWLAALAQRAPVRRARGGKEGV